MSILDGMKTRVTSSGELLQFFMHNKRWWLVPMVVVLLFFGVMILLAETSAIAPFIYTLF